MNIGTPRNAATQRSFEIDVNKAQSLKFKSLDFNSARAQSKSINQMSTLQQSAIRSINKYYQKIKTIIYLLLDQIIFKTFQDMKAIFQCLSQKIQRFHNFIDNQSLNLYFYIFSVLKELSDIYIQFEDNNINDSFINKRMDYKSEVSDNLMSLKKSYDTLRNMYLQKDKEIIKMRNELEIMSLNENKMSNCVYGNEEKHEVLQTEYAKLNQQLLESESNRKTYNHMIDRMRNDIQVYKLQANERKEVLDQGNAVLSQANIRLSQIQFKEVKAHLALEEVRKHKQQIDQERELNLSRFQQDMEIQVEMEKQREDRIKRQYEIAEIASTDMRDTNIKKWRNLQLVNEFLSAFLKRRMEKEMQNYEEIEKSFQKIKAATGISEAGEIVHKFLNRESTYSRLLISIEEYERKIDNLKKKNEQLKQKLQNIKSEMPQDRVENKQALLEIDELETKFQNTQNKAEQAKLAEQKIYIWGINYIAKIERVLGLSNEKTNFYLQKYQKSDISKLLQDILSHIKQNIIEADSEKIQQIITESYKKIINLDQDNDFKKRNNRIKDNYSDHSHKGSVSNVSKVEITENDSHQEDGDSMVKFVGEFSKETQTLK